MNIVEVKNNLVKFVYKEEENIVLSSFVYVKAEEKTYIAQVIHQESCSNNCIAIAKLLFIYDEQLKNYDGSIPSIKATVGQINTEEMISLLDAKNPIIVGKIAEQNTGLVLDKSLLEENLLLCSDNKENTNIIISNLNRQVKSYGKKTVIIDTTGDYKDDSLRLVATKDFKLPLNYETINFIYDKGIKEANAESKALIQDIFLELQEYVKTLPDKYIPFDNFKSVVDDQFEQTQILQLVLLKNKLLKYKEEGIFAQTKEEIKNITEALKYEQSLVIDLSKTQDDIQQEFINYIYSILGEYQTEIYSFLMCDNTNTDKKLLKQIYSTQNVHTTSICSFSYKYLVELKQISANIIMLSPILQQQFFATYNIFLNRLTSEDFIICGKATKNIPFIVKNETIKETLGVSSGIFDAEEMVKKEVIEEKPFVYVPKKQEEYQEPIDNTKTEIVESIQIPVKNSEKEEIVNKKEEENVVSIYEEIPLEEYIETEKLAEQEISFEEIVNNQKEEQENVEENLKEEILFEEVETYEMPQDLLDLNNQSSIQEDVEETETFTEVVPNYGLNEFDLQESGSEKTKNLPEENSKKIQRQQSITNIDEEINKDLDEVLTYVGEDLPPIQQEDIDLTEEDLDFIDELSFGDDLEEISEQQNTEEESFEAMPAPDSGILITPINDDLPPLDLNTEDDGFVLDIDETSTIPEFVEYVPEETTEQFVVESSVNDYVEMEEEKEEPIMAPPVDILPTSLSSTPIVPQYTAEIPEEDLVNNNKIEQGDTVVHPKHGKGVVEKMISYGSKTLCSINFENSGIKLLDPTIAELKKV